MPENAYTTTVHIPGIHSSEGRMSHSGPKDDATNPFSTEASLSGKILIADDSPHILALIRALLQMRGFSVLTALSREEALLHCQNEGEKLRAAIVDFSLCSRRQADPGHA